MDVARLNFSHGDYKTHRQLAAWVRAAAEEEGCCVALLQDIQGPKIRVGTFSGGSTTLQAGSEGALRAGDGRGDADRVYINYPYLLEDLRQGEDVLLADGLIRLHVTGTTAEGLLARVVVGGELGDHKGVAFPHSELRMPVVTEKDHRDLTF